MQEGLSTPNVVSVGGTTLNLGTSGTYLSESLAGNLGRAEAGGGAGVGADPIDRLSNRELQVLSLIGRGMSSREAAEALGL